MQEQKLSILRQGNLDVKQKRQKRKYQILNIVKSDKQGFYKKPAYNI
jgi:hypothetical protein